MWDITLLLCSNKFAKYYNWHIYLSIGMSVNIHICLFMHISKTTCSKFSKLSVRYIYGHGLVFLWWQRSMLCTTSFVATSFFHKMGHTAYHRVGCNAAHFLRLTAWASHKFPTYLPEEGCHAVCLLSSYSMLATCAPGAKSCFYWILCQ